MLANVLPKSGSLRPKTTDSRVLTKTEMHVGNEHPRIVHTESTSPFYGFLCFYSESCFMCRPSLMVHVDEFSLMMVLLKPVQNRVVSEQQLNVLSGKCCVEIVSDNK